jgi:putative sigma-54 modulation protein
MQILITGKNVPITSALRAYITRKMSRLVRFHRRLISADVVLETHGHGHTVEVLLKAGKGNVIITTHSEKDMYACFDHCLDRMARKLRDAKEKMQRHKGRLGLSEASIEEYAEDTRRTA